MLRPWNTIITIDFNDKLSVYQQIANRILTEIKKGRLKPGIPLPGSRVLAQELRVNRKTVLLAYDILIAEGWLETAHKKGTFVSHQLPLSGIKQTKDGHLFGFKDHLQLFSGRTAAEGKLITFNDGLPDVHLTPLDELAKAYKRIFQQKTRWRMLGYAHEQGEERLRMELAAMLAHKRGMNVDAAQVCITRGSQMALYLTIQTLISPGDVVAIESPGYLPAWNTFNHAGATILPVPVDEKGMVVDVLEQLCKTKKIKALYVTPHHQFPTTVSMKMERRLQLIELSNRYGFAIIEDDYDHEYHFTGKGLLPLASNENAANIIYIGSLSKLLAPAVRIGYVTGPIQFIKALAGLRAIIDRQGDTIMENAIAELMEEGTINRHIKRAHTVYRERRELMAHYLDSYLADHLSYEKPEGGLAYWVKIRKVINTQELAVSLLKKGVSILPTEPFSFTGEPLNALRLGYGSLTKTELENGLEIISAVLSAQ